jgi:plastocyanin
MEQNTPSMMNSIRRFPHFLCLALSVLAGQTAFSQPSPSPGELRGVISLSRRAQDAVEHAHSPYQGHYSGRGATSALTGKNPDPSRLSESAVVYLESEDLNNRQYPAPAEHPMLDQKNLQFHPQVLPVLVGTTVDFPNKDHLFHNVFSYSQTKEFDLGRYPYGDSKSIIFDRPGVVRVYCDIHAHMNATVLVLRNPYFVCPNDSGFFLMKNVPEGRYALVLWIDREQVERRSVEIKGGRTTDVEFVK